jgi:protein tyrosine phosphatase type 4A
MATLHSHSLVTDQKHLGLLSFLITDCPQPDKESLVVFCNLQKANSSIAIVRISNPTYDTELLISNGISVYEFYFEDGSVPSDDLVTRYLTLLDRIKEENKDKEITIGIHCVSGIGRAPLLVCLALVDGGMERLDAVAFIREKRRGAINNKQLAWLSDKRGFKKRGKSGFFSTLFKKNNK